MFVVSFCGALALILTVEHRLARRDATRRAHEARLKAILELSFVGGIVIVVAGAFWDGLVVVIAAMSASAASAVIDEHGDFAPSVFEN
jgi:uncharacterized protein YciI